MVEHLKDRNCGNSNLLVGRGEVRRRKSSFSFLAWKSRERKRDLELPP
jgi:hypothetical protein